ncbi:NTF2-like N-terminal transpeptidase domain-containing protein [Paenibacillus tarimensis]
MFCTSCGTKLEENAQHCSSCGAVVTPSAPVPPSHPQAATPIYKKPAFMAAAVLILIVGFLLLRESSGSMSSPEATVEAFVHAVDNKDIKTLASLYSPENQPDTDELEEAEEFFLGMLGNIKVNDFEILDVTVDEDTAHVEYRVEVSLDGETNTDTDDFDLIKIDGKWYIDDSFAF